MNIKEQELLSMVYPPQLLAKANIVSIKTERSPTQVIAAATSLGLEILEEIANREYAFLKIDSNGRTYSLNGEPIDD